MHKLGGNVSGKARNGKKTKGAKAQKGKTTKAGGKATKDQQPNEGEERTTRPHQTRSLQQQLLPQSFHGQVALERLNVLGPPDKKAVFAYHGTVGDGAFEDKCKLKTSHSADKFPEMQGTKGQHRNGQWDMSMPWTPAEQLVIIWHLQQFNDDNDDEPVGVDCLNVNMWEHHRIVTIFLAALIEPADALLVDGDEAAGQDIRYFDIREWTSIHQRNVLQGVLALSSENSALQNDLGNVLMGHEGMDLVLPATFWEVVVSFVHMALPAGAAGNVSDD